MRESDEEFPPGWCAETVYWRGPMSTAIVIARRRRRRRAAGQAWRYRIHGEVAAENSRMAVHGRPELDREPTLHVRARIQRAADAGPTDTGPTDSGPTDSGPTGTGPTDS